jgi:hypothetical protein
MGLHLDTKERAFVEQKELFLATALRMLGADRLENLPDPTDRLAAPLPPVVIDDYRQLDSKSISAIASAYWGENGAALFIVLNPSAPGHKSHPLLEIAEQLSDVLPLRFPVDHPMEGHPEAASRFGTSDGTLKIYDLETKDSKIGYREQATMTDWATPAPSKLSSFMQTLRHCGADTPTSKMLFLFVSGLLGKTRMRSRHCSCRMP